MGALKQFAISASERMGVGIKDVLPGIPPPEAPPASKFFTKQAVPSLLRSGGVILGSAYLLPGEFGRHLMGGIGFETGFRFGRHKFGGGLKTVGLGLAGAVAGSLSYYGFKGAFSGFNDEYNLIEGLHPGSQGFGAQSIRLHTEFGSGWRKVGDFARRIFSGMHKGLKTERYILEQSAAAAREALPSWKTAWRDPQLVARGEEAFVKAAKIAKRQAFQEKRFFERGGAESLTRIVRQPIDPYAGTLPRIEPLNINRVRADAEAYHQLGRTIFKPEIIPEPGLARNAVRANRPIDIRAQGVPFAEPSVISREGRRLPITNVLEQNQRDVERIRALYLAESLSAEAQRMPKTIAGGTPPTPGLHPNLIKAHRVFNITDDFVVRAATPPLSEEAKKLPRTLVLEETTRAIKRMRRFNKISQEAVGVGFRQAKKATTGSKTFNSTPTLT